MTRSRTPCVSFSSTWILLANPGGLSLSEINAHLGTTRKFGVPLLEHLDAIGVTRRAGDRRVVGNKTPCD